MLRLVLGQTRRRLTTDSGCTLEPWVDWVRRVTKRAEDKMKELGYLDWNGLQQRQKLQWAERLDEFEEDRWAKIAYHWRPDLFTKTWRGRGRPKRRWDDA